MTTANYPEAYDHEHTSRMLAQHLRLYTLHSSAAWCDFLPFLNHVYYMTAYSPTRRLPAAVIYTEALLGASAHDLAVGGSPCLETRAGFTEQLASARIT